MPSQKNLPYIYILSTGRTGTKLISQIMGELYPELNITHQGEWSRLINIAGNILLIDSLPSYLVTYLIKKIFKNLKKQKIPDSTVDPLLSVPISLFLKNNIVFTEYKIVHLIRDPRDFVASFINWKNQRIRRFLLHHFIPFWQPNPIFCENLSVSQRIRMNKFNHFSWIWNFKNSFFAKLFAHKENYYLVRMEDLVDAQKGQENFGKLFTFLELPSRHIDWDHILNEKVNISKRRCVPNWRNWDSKQASVVEKYCGELMKKYGYGTEEEWQAKL